MDEKKPFRMYQRCGSKLFLKSDPESGRSKKQTGSRPRLSFDKKLQLETLKPF